MCVCVYIYIYTHILHTQIYVYINICVEKYVYEEIDCPEILNNPISPNTSAQIFIDMFP